MYNQHNEINAGVNTNNNNKDCDKVNDKRYDKNNASIAKDTLISESCAVIATNKDKER